VKYVPKNKLSKSTYYQSRDGLPGCYSTQKDVSSHQEVLGDPKEEEQAGTNSPDATGVDLLIHHGQGEPQGEPHHVQDHTECDPPPLQFVLTARPSLDNSQKSVPVHYNLRNLLLQLSEKKVQINLSPKMADPYDTDTHRNHSRNLLLHLLLPPGSRADTSAHYIIINDNQAISIPWNLLPTGQFPQLCLALPFEDGMEDNIASFMCYLTSIPPHLTSHEFFFGDIPHVAHVYADGLTPTTLLHLIQEAQQRNMFIFVTTSHANHINIISRYASHAAI
jgi:hypothetical protein